MMPARSFKEFVEEGLVVKQSPNIPRANFLTKESEKANDFVNNLIKTMGLTDESANSVIKLCYDVIMELVRAKMLIKGYNTTGAGAHEAEVAYLRELGIGENDVQFADQLRYFRNGMMYYGKIFDRDYAEKVLAFMKKLYAKLKV